MSMSRLVVAFGGQEQWDITGDAESMRQQYGQLKDALEAPDGTSGPFFELIGMRNLADRNSESFFVRLEAVKGVDLQEA